MAGSGRFISSADRCMKLQAHLWGLGAFGQPGVERVLEVMRVETRAAMQQ